MKLRLKFGSVTKFHEVDENAVVTYTLSDLKSAGRDLFPNIQCPLSLSLNKRTPLEGDDVSLKDHGIVSGDLLYVLTQNNDLPEPRSGSGRPKPLPLGCVSVSEMFLATHGKKSDNSESELKVNSDSEVSQRDGVRSCETQARDSSLSENTAGCSKALLDCSAESSGCHIEDAGCSSDTSSTGNDFNMASGEVDRMLVNRYLSEPFLCRESTPGRVPSILDDIYNSVNITTPHEAMCVVLHVLMLESGYECADQEQEIQCDRNVCDSETELSTCTAMDTQEDVTSEDKVGMPRSWNCQAGRYSMKYVHTSCDRRTTFLLTCVPMGSVLVIHGTVMGYRSDKLQMNLNTSEYIADLNNGAVGCYKNLSKLSRIYKDGLAHRLLQEYKFAKGEETNFGIFLLSHEVMLRIVGRLDTVSVLRLSQTCKVFNTLCKDNYVWRRLYLKDFGNRTDNSLNHYWQKLYKQEYRLRKERQRIWKRNPMPVFTPPMIPSFGLPPPGPFHPGILGGDHDLNPLINHSEDRFFPHQLLGQRGQHGNASFMSPRFDPVGPLPGHNVIPGRRGGPRDRRGPFGGFGGPKLF